jgi:hypothetical protein
MYYFVPTKNAKVILSSWLERRQIHLVANPALQGWAFELEQIKLIRLSYKSHKENPGVYATNGLGLFFIQHHRQSSTKQIWHQGLFKMALSFGVRSGINVASALLSTSIPHTDHGTVHVARVAFSKTAVCLEVVGRA